MIIGRVKIDFVCSFCSSKKNLLKIGSERRKNLGSRVALLPGKFMRVRKAFVRITGKPDKLSEFFQIICHFLDDFKTVHFTITYIVLCVKILKIYEHVKSCYPESFGFLRLCW